MVLEGMKDLAVLEAPDPQPRDHLNGGRGGSGVLLKLARRPPSKQTTYTLHARLRDHKLFVVC
jgi:hypothetical protein